MWDVMSKSALIGLLGLGIAYIYSQFFRAFLPVLTPELTEQLGATQENLSTAAAAWFIIFGLFQFPVGVMLDRIGPRRTVAYLFGFAGTAGVMLFAVSTKPWMIIVAMSLIGIGCAPVLMGSLFIFARKFEAKQLALLTSLLVAFGNLGNIASTAPLAKATNVFGWRPVLWVIAASTVAVALLIYRFVSDPEPDPEATDNTGLAGFIELLKIKTLWPILLMGIVLYAPVANLRGLWAGPYLANVFEADSLLIGKVTLWMGIAMILGSLAYGPLDKLLNTRKWIIFAGNFITLSAIAVLAVNPTSSVTQVTFLFIVVGLFGTGYGVLMAHGRSFVPKALTGRGVTLLNFTTIFGAGMMQYLTGAVANQHSNPVSTQAYQSVFWTYVIVSGVALMVYLFSKDAKPNS